MAFQSLSSNLDPADTDPDPDVYVKDLTNGDITLASTSDAGVKSNAEIQILALALSGNGTRVAFQSSATNLDSGDTDDRFDIYVKDLKTGDVTLASTSDSGVKSNGSHNWSPSLSSDGTKVAFQSLASNLDPADTDTLRDVYVKDLLTGDISLASTSDEGIKGNDSPDSISFETSRNSLSSDGTTVAFESAATNLDPVDSDTVVDVYVKELGPPPGPSADLSLTKSDSPDPARVRAKLGYKIEVTNLGPDTATNVTVSDELPAGVTFGFARSAQGTCTHAGGTVTCDLGALAHGASAVVKIAVRPTASGTITNTADVSATEADQNLANNHDEEQTTVR